jgi:phage FluMu protein Com
MKIISPGKLPENQVYEITCPNCKCIFEFESKEATPNKDHKNGNYLTIKCPFCEYFCRINE